MPSSRQSVPKSILLHELTKKYQELRMSSRHFEEWSDTIIGADLWIDGYDALQSTSLPVFDAFAKTLLKIHECDHTLTAFSRTSLNDYLGSCDLLLRFCRKQPQRFWHALAVGIALVHACGGTPSLNTEDTSISIINDTEMILLSKTYRSIRFCAYNMGITLVTSNVSEPDWFFPEFGSVRFGADYFVKGDTDKIQHYNVNHDLAHTVLFGGSHLKASSERELTLSLVLNAEEYCCGIDLALIAELSAYGIDLHLLKEFRGIEPLEQAATAVSVAEWVARNPCRIPVYQRALKAAAQRAVGASNSIASLIVKRDTGKPHDLHGWVSQGALKKHILGAKQMVDRLSGPCFQRFRNELSVHRTHVQNLYKAVREEWQEGHQPFDLRCPGLSQAAREKASAQLRTEGATLLLIYEIDSQLSNSGRPLSKKLQSLTYKDLLDAATTLPSSCIAGGPKMQAQAVAQSLICS